MDPFVGSIGATYGAKMAASTIASSTSPNTIATLSRRRRRQTPDQ